MMFTTEELDYLETACLAAATVARMGGNDTDANYFHSLADKCREVNDMESEPKVWELIMDYHNCSADKALELEPSVYKLVCEGYGVQEAIAMLGL